MFDRTHDARVRSAAFEWLADQVMRYGDVLPRKVLEQGFFMDDVRVPFVRPLAYFNDTFPNILNLGTIFWQISVKDRVLMRMTNSAVFQEVLYRAVVSGQYKFN